MNDYKELVAKLRKWQTLGDAPVGNGFGVIVDKLTLKQAADVIEHLVKERDEWQDRYFEKTREYFRLEQERDAYAKAFRITTSYEPLMNHAVVKVDYNAVNDCDREELMRAIVYRLARTIEDAQSKEESE